MPHDDVWMQPPNPSEAGERPGNGRGAGRPTGAMFPEFQ
ncbi:MAG: hypothetical protein OJF60_001862 [Burkholderiaceae bacterium]|nr:MAG: hypothetical protein OJF60_001862 [Burkholderiaceae bacterium]